MKFDVAPQSSEVEVSLDFIGENAQLWLQVVTSSMEALEIEITPESLLKHGGYGGLYLMAMASVSQGLLPQYRKLREYLTGLPGVHTSEVNKMNDPMLNEIGVAAVQVGIYASAGIQLYKSQID